MDKYKISTIILLLITIILATLLYMSKKQTKPTVEEVTDSREYICIQKVDDTTTLRDEIKYDETGKIISFKSGSVIKLSTQEELANVLDGAQLNESQYDKLSDMEVFVYDYLQTSGTSEDGYNYETWYKDIINSKTQANYTCTKK